MPERPLTRLSQKSGTVWPAGVMAPRPVTTTRVRDRNVSFMAPPAANAERHAKKDGAATASLPQRSSNGVHDREGAATSPREARDGVALKAGCLRRAGPACNPRQDRRRGIYVRLTRDHLVCGTIGVPNWSTGLRAGAPNGGPS